MNHPVDIEVLLDGVTLHPRVTIQAKTRTEQVENIIWAIEHATENEYPLIPGYDEQGIHLVLLSQRDIIRVYVSGRKLVLQTEAQNYISNMTLSGVEELLNTDRFIRISKSEIVNLYKIRQFEFSRSGTIGVVFDNGATSWTSRSRVKALKNALSRYGGQQNEKKES